jgi:hypothetical protein
MLDYHQLFTARLDPLVTFEITLSCEPSSIVVEAKVDCCYSGMYVRGEAFIVSAFCTRVVILPAALGIRDR